MGTVYPNFVYRPPDFEQFIKERRTIKKQTAIL
jgi:hypothetical protein